MRSHLLLSFIFILLIFNSKAIAQQKEKALPDVKQLFSNTTIDFTDSTTVVLIAYHGISCKDCCKVIASFLKQKNIAYYFVLPNNYDAINCKKVKERLDYDYQPKGVFKYISAQTETEFPYVYIKSKKSITLFKYQDIFNVGDMSLSAPIIKAFEKLKNY